MKIPDDLQAAINAEPKEEDACKTQRTESPRACVLSSQHEDRSGAKKKSVAFVERSKRREAIYPQKKIIITVEPEWNPIIAGMQFLTGTPQEDPMTQYTIKRAITDEEILDCHPVMAELRPHISATDFVPAVRRMEKQGYALACLVEEGSIRAVAGYRIIEMLRTGRMLEIDDLITSSATRSKGYGKQLFEWVVEEARRKECSHVELDSAVHREHAHRFYFRERLHVLGFHFSVALG